MKLSKSSVSKKVPPKITLKKASKEPRRVEEDEELGEVAPRKRRALPPPELPAPLPKRDLMVAKHEKNIKPPKIEDQEDLESDDTDELGQRLLPGVSKRTLRRLNSMFGQRADSIIDLLELADTDGAASLTTRTLVQTLVDILPVAERAVRRSKGTRGVMGLNQIISQVRELLHDLQAYKDRDQVGQTIVDRFVRPGFMDMAMQMTNLMVELDNQARNKMSKDDYSRYHATADQLRGSLADYMRRQYEDMAKGIRSSI
jgi:hypothetical protein